MGVTITRKFSFDSGHRVWGHEGKCRHLHGHTYTAEVTFSAPELDGIGRVIDFGEVKKIAGGWIEKYWDHGFLCHKDDILASIDPDGWEVFGIGYEEFVTEVFQGRLPYIMRNGNPTAENMAKELFQEVSKLLPKPIKVTHVRIWETPNCYADYHQEDKS